MPSWRSPGQRVDQTQTSVTTFTVSGVPGTTIPEGSQAQTAAGDIFASLEPVTLPSGGPPRSISPPWNMAPSHAPRMP